MLPLLSSSGQDKERPRGGLVGDGLLSTGGRERASSFPEL